MIIAISGSVGSGKTTISMKLGEKLGFDVVPLNNIAKDFKLKEVKELETFDFDLEKLLDFVEKKIEFFRKGGESVIFEGHFAHFIDPKLIDVLFVINRDLKELKREYERRDYNLRKQQDNLEVESFNLCFYEAIEEGYLVESENAIMSEGGEDERDVDENGEGVARVYSIDNKGDLDEIISGIIKIINNLNKS